MLTKPSTPHVIPALPSYSDLTRKQYKEVEQAKIAIAKALSHKLPFSCIDKVVSARRSYDEARRIYNAAIMHAADEVFRI